MFTQVPNKPPYDKDPTQQPQVRDYMTMLQLFNTILTEAPEFNEYDLVGFPINAILDWSMGTPSGFTAFYLDSINAQFRKMLNVWATFLVSPASCYVLTTNPGGWFSAEAMKAMEGFTDDFVCDPTQPFWGFTSWDNFFTRLFREGRRPLPPDDDNLVVSACESTVYNFISGVQDHDLFWLKENSYSLMDMLDNHPYTPQFVGGTVYQAFLSALNYHRWNTPINGTVVDTQVVPGTYYSETPVVGMDPAAPNNSQGYITSVATRAMIYIQADNPKIGLMCFMAVGMAEVSTCEITVQKGMRLTKGDELGMFHFGGSTHCLIFRPETKIQFTDVVQVGNQVKLNEAIGYITD